MTATETEDASVTSHPLFVLFAGGFASQIVYKMYSGMQYSGIPENVVWGRCMIGLTAVFVLVVVGLAKFG